MLVTTRVMRTIDFRGGLDNYLLDTPDRKLDSEKAVQLKNELMQTILTREKEKFRARPLEEEAKKEVGKKELGKKVVAKK